MFWDAFRQQNNFGLLPFLLGLAAKCKTACCCLTAAWTKLIIWRDEKASYPIVPSFTRLCLCLWPPSDNHPMADEFFAPLSKHHTRKFKCIRTGIKNFGIWIPALEDNLSFRDSLFGKFCRITKKSNISVGLMDEMRENCQSDQIRLEWELKGIHLDLVGTMITLSTLSHSLSTMIFFHKCIAPDKSGIFRFPGFKMFTQLFM